jgi:hypothetical protein
MMEDSLGAVPKASSGGGGSEKSRNKTNNQNVQRRDHKIGGGAAFAGSSLSSSLPDQLDALLLDEYLVSLLIPQCQAMFQRFTTRTSGGGDADAAPITSSSSSITSSSTMQSILQIIILLWSLGQTPAAQQLGLQLETTNTKNNCNNTDSSSVATTSLLERRDGRYSRRLVLYLFLSVVLPCVYGNVRQSWLERIQRQQRREEEEVDEEVENVFPMDDDDIDEHQILQQRRRLQLAQQRKAKAMQFLLQSIDTIVPFAKLSLLLLSWSAYGVQRNHEHHYLSSTTSTTTTLPVLSDKNSSGGSFSGSMNPWRRWIRHDFLNKVSPHWAMALAGLRYTTPLAQQSLNNSSDQSSPSPLHVLYGHRRWMTEEFLRLGPLVLIPVKNVLLETRTLISFWWWYVVVLMFFLVVVLQTTGCIYKHKYKPSLKARRDRIMLLSFCELENI